MLAKAILYIVALVHLAEFSPRVKYFIIETQDIGKTKLGVKKENNKELEDNWETKQEMEGDDYAENSEEHLKPKLTKQGRK